MLKAAYLREAVNTLFQGSAADLIKLSMINIHLKYKDNPNVKMLLQIHDELIFEIKESSLPFITKEIEHNGEKFVPYKYLKENYLSYNKYNYNWFKNKTNLVNIKILPYDIIQKLLEWHFDVYNLIPQNLAIDINTLEK